MITIKTEREIALMREAGRIVAETHALLAESLKPGISTLELDAIAEDYIRGKGAIPSFKNYNGFSGSICASINDVVVHGIPSADTILKEGDIISFDVGAILNGYHGDAARTLPCGQVDQAALDLIEVTRASFEESLKYAREGYRLSDIGHAVQEYCESRGYGVVRDFCGHGIGTSMHEDPQIPNYGRPGRGVRLKTGMCLAIEPMITEGTWEVTVQPDGWTVLTNDGKRAAHHENTIALTADGPVILTAL
ncbi:type I methionyl aminopeptidase [Peptococcus simiae]|uniref:type I methionyl aminopeptidase n=1 Tax=Peptococcus simiae TaxID=1643805 RepID=UPI00397FBF82